MRQPIRLLPLALGLALTSACSSSGLSYEQKKKAVEQMTETAQQYFAMGEFDRANAQCIKGLELDPGNDKLELIRAWTLQKRGKTEDIAQAETMFRELQSTGDFRAVLGLAEACERRGLAFAEAADRMRTGRHVSEAADPAERVRQYESEAQKRWQESRDLYEKALGMQRQNVDAVSGLVRAEALLGNAAASYDWAKKLIDLATVDRDYWDGQLKRANLSAEDEREIQRQARAKRKTLSTARQTAGDLAMTLRKDDEALAHLDAAIELDPTFAPNFSRRAQVRHDLGDFAGAVRDLEQFIAVSQLDANHPDIQRAFRFRRECEDKARAAQAAAAPR